MKRKKKEAPSLTAKSWHFCHECQIKRGGKVPEHGHNGITVTKGRCPGCGEENVFLVPNADYHWPKIGVRAVFD